MFNVTYLPMHSPLYAAYARDPEAFERAIRISAAESAKALGLDSSCLFSIKETQQEINQKAA